MQGNGNMGGQERGSEESLARAQLRVLERISLEGLKELRRQRRWRIFFRFAFFGLVVMLFALPFLRGAYDKVIDGHTALVRVEGIIAPGGQVDADDTIEALQAAFEDEGARGVVLRINSPGGSPVQSDRIYREIRRLRRAHPDKKLYAVVEDIGASGGYYIAAAADEIYAAAGSIVGSIGVLMNGFGFVGAMKKMGVERRLLTAGEHKGMLDPFLPEDPAERAFAQALIDRVHQQFIDAVKAGRGDRLAEDEKIFSGLFWTGEDAAKLGLVDGIGDQEYVARELIGEEEIIDYTRKRDWLDRFAEGIGASAARTLLKLESVAAPSLR